MHRGHEIYLSAGQWRYCDDNSLVSQNPNRDCGFCGRRNTPEGHDGCLGTIAGVMNACCGHGDNELSYVQFADGNAIYGEEACEFLSRRRVATEACGAH